MYHNHLSWLSPHNLIAVFQISDAKGKIFPVQPNVAYIFLIHLYSQREHTFANIVPFRNFTKMLQAGWLNVFLS